tara:strand:+ start:65 stop:454 length:390 start_codon:yes stop_codon:yes gene_type:complete
MDKSVRVTVAIKKALRIIAPLPKDLVSSTYIPASKKTALGEQAKIGSVDKFQGQEAPVVILSMCASDASESPRGMDFLLDKNRLNVAISRAQSLAIVVGNPNLSQTQVNRVDQLKLVNLFSQVVLRALI